MGGLRCIFVLACAYFVHRADGRKTYRDMFPHKHPGPGKLPFPIPDIPGWDPDSKSWDDYLYPPFGPKPKELTHRKGKPLKVQLTSDSPAINGSSISFTAKLQYPPCQKEDANGDLVWDEHCDDANGQVHSGYVYNWTSWLDDYGFGKCPDPKRCNVFPDGKPFPQSNEWRRKSYVYVWHTMGQYFETCDGSSSSLTLNTTNFPLGGEVIEVMVYKKRERRKYSPLATDNAVFFVTDKIPLAVNISQKTAANLSANVFYNDEEIVFLVEPHDPSGYLKTAAFVNYIWDFRDGNHLVTHRKVATHAYSTLGSISVKLMVEAGFPAECPPPSTTPSSKTSTSLPATHAVTSKVETTKVPSSTWQPNSTTTPVAITTGQPTTESLPPTVTDVMTEFSPATKALLRNRRQVADSECYRYIYGNFVGDITIIERKHALNNKPASQIVDVSAAKVTNSDISFLVKCIGSTPTSACTIVSDSGCNKVRNIMCDDVLPASGCEVYLRRTFSEPGTYCVNITLEDSSSLAVASTTITISKTQEVTSASKTSQAAEVVLSSSAVLGAVFAIIAYLVYKRYKVYRPVRRSLLEDGSSRGCMSRLREVLFAINEESRHLLTHRRPL
ncbi:protein QNR-71 [Lampris incognitus]|uniref:protein QNR-71 n=1 Tax=Lampris incognitus TaxID=2546036 RepID=UPI0024B63642|nr:protein QNR-71 [Lampris incognitus]